MKYYCHQFLRFMYISLKHPKALIAFLLMKLNKFPFFNAYYSIHDAKPYRVKVGYAAMKRFVDLKFINKKIIRLNLCEGNNLTAFHFYLNRPVIELFHLIKDVEATLAVKFIYNSKQSIFEPGCGPGRFIKAFIDKYGGHALGVDGYSPAIELANISRLSNSEVYYVDDFSTPERISKILDSNYDYSFTSSFLVHMSKNRKARQFLLKIMPLKSKIVFGTEMWDKDLYNDLVESGYITHTTNSKIRYMKMGNVNEN